MILRRILTMALAMLLFITATPVFAANAKSDYNMPYYIEVDLTNQIVTIYSTVSDVIVRQMLCSSGLKNETPSGTFYLPRKEEPAEREEWYYFRMYGCWAHYATRIYKGVLFHSLPCSRKSDSSISVSAVEEFGHPASHGCVRLLWQDAEFIAKCCLEGTRVHVYKSKKRDPELREMLYESSYTNEKGQTYQAYLGIPEEEGVMGRYSKGSDVRDLQTRLRDLGIFNDEINGEYGATTVNAVREAQRLLGEEQTGVATLEFQSAIYAEDAPTAQNVPVEEGMSGPVVRNMQRYLQTLHLYDGEIDGIYDVDVREAVIKFQGAYGYKADAVMTPVMQKALYYEAGKVSALFLNDGCECDITSGQLYMGQVVSQVGIRLRSRASAGSEALGRLASGDRVVALEHGKEWSKVQREKDIGYVNNKYLEYYQMDVYALKYASPDGTKTYSVGYTPKEYYEGAKIPAEAFETYLAASGSLENYEGVTTYARVVTESDDILLNLRQSPNTVSPILAELPSGSEMKVLLRSTEWSLVEWGGQNGYLLNKYLEFWAEPTEQAEGGEEGEDAPVEGGDESVLPAMVSAEGGKAAVYDVDSDDAAALGHLKNGTRVEVLETVDGWSHIRYQGHMGYMKDVDLQFLLTEEVVT